ncbi:MAG: GNAT family N-acetyltransferase [Anaerolineae bacterium]
MRYSIRETRPEDAAAIIAYLRALTAETDINVPLTPEEFTFTEQEERDYIQAVLADPRRLMLVAVDEAGTIIGELSLNGSSRKALRHAVELGISVRWDWRGRGVGSALLERAITWAQAGGLIKRIELRVYARNAPAIALYRKFGFVEEGRRRAAVYQYGEYLDDLIMARLLE